MARRNQLLLGAITAGLLIAVSVTSSFIQMHRLATAADAHQEATEKLVVLTNVRHYGSQMVLAAGKLLLAEDTGQYEAEFAAAVNAFQQSAEAIGRLLEAEHRDSKLLPGLEGVGARTAETIAVAESFLQAARVGQWGSARDFMAAISFQQELLGGELSGLFQLWQEMDLGLSAELTSARRDAAVSGLLSIVGLVLGALFLAITMQPMAEPWVKSAQLNMIERLSTLLSVAPNLNHLFDGVRQEILSQVEAVGVSIMLLTPEGERLHWIYGFEYGKEIDLSIVDPLPISRGLSGYVARTGKMLLVNEGVEEKQLELGSHTIGSRPAAWLGLPLIVASELVGVLAIENDAPFPGPAVQLLRTVAGPVAIAIHNLVQLEKVQAALQTQSRQQVQLQAAAEIAAAATSTLQLDELMQQSVDLIRARFGYYFVGIYLVDQETQNAVLKAGTGEAGQRQMAGGHQMTVGGQSAIGATTSDGLPRIVQDVTLEKEWSPNPHLPDTSSELVLPLRVRDHIIGALTVQGDSAHAFSPQLVGTLQTMSDQLAVAIENTQLVIMAEARVKQQQRLNEISAQLHRATDVPEIIGIGLQALSERLANCEVQLSLGVPGTGEMLEAD
jgi:GAF domain-containing protein